MEQLPDEATHEATHEETQKIMIGRELVETPRSEHLGQILELFIRGRTNKMISGILGIPQQKMTTTKKN